MGGSTQKTTSTTGPTNPQVNKTQTTLLKGLEDAYAGGIAVNPQSLYPGVGATTQNAWQETLGAASDPTYSNAVRGATSYAGNLAGGTGPSLTEQTLMGTARGDYLDEQDPAFNRDLSRTLDDTGADVNSFFGASGRLGSSPHVNDMVSSLGGVRDKALMGQRENSRNRQMQALGAIEGQRQQGIGNAFAAQAALPGLFQASLAPSAVRGAVGSAQDADALAKRQADNDLFRRKNDGKWDSLGRASSILNGTAGVGGQTTTNTSPATPWWQTALGGAIGLGGMFL